MPSALPTDPEEYLRRRGHARAATALWAMFLVPQVASLVQLARSDSTQTRATAGFVFFVLVLAAAVTGYGVLTLWRRSYAARPHVLPLDATPGQVVGVPELDEPSGRHLGLGGEQEPPTRW